MIIMLSLFLMGVWEFWGRENMAYEEILVLKEPLGASSLLTEECFKTKKVDSPSREALKPKDVASLLGMETSQYVAENVDNIHSPNFFNESIGTGFYSDITAKKADKLITLTNRIESIEAALFSIPEKYREGIKQKLVDGKSYGDEFHPNTWKKWQQVYIYNVAKNLGLI